jgi:hypothetical protein
VGGSAPAVAHRRASSRISVGRTGDINGSAPAVAHLTSLRDLACAEKAAHPQLLLSKRMQNTPFVRGEWRDGEAYEGVAAPYG